MKEKNNKLFNRILVASLSLVFVGGGFFAVSASTDAIIVEDIASEVNKFRAFNFERPERPERPEGFEGMERGERLERLASLGGQERPERKSPEDCEFFANLSEEEKAEKLAEIEAFRAERDAFRAERELAGGGPGFMGDRMGARKGMGLGEKGANCDGNCRFAGQALEIINE